MCVSYNSPEFTSEGYRALDLPRALDKLCKTRRSYAEGLVSGSSKKKYRENFSLSSLIIVNLGSLI